MKEVFAIQVEGNKNSPATTGTIQAEIWNKSERFKRASKRGALCFLIACLCAPLPVAHFVLVPSFLLATPCVFAYFYGKHSALIEGNATCPQCNNELALGNSSFDFPKNQMCDKCFHILKITLLKKEMGPQT